MAQIVAVDVWIPISQDGSQILRKQTYYYETEDVEWAKARAVAEFVKNEVPPILAVSWKGPFSAAKGETKKRTSGSSGSPSR